MLAALAETRMVRRRDVRAAPITLLLRHGCQGVRWNWFVHGAAAHPQPVQPSDRGWPRCGSSGDTLGYHITALATLREVRAAGILLRNCLAHAGSAVAVHQRARPLFLVQSKVHAPAVFSVAEGPHSGWQLWEIRGRYNAPVAPHLLAAVKRFVHELPRQAAQD